MTLNGFHSREAQSLRAESSKPRRRGSDYSEDPRREGFPPRRLAGILGKYESLRESDRLDRQEYEKYLSLVRSLYGIPRYAESGVVRLVRNQPGTRTRVMTALRITGSVTLQAFIGFLLAFMAWWAFDNYAGSVEGFFLPVARANKVDVVWINNQTIEFSGTMIKHRDCRFERLRAEVFNNNGRSVVAPIRVLEATKIRPPGVEPWGPWIVEVPTLQQKPRVRIRARHECHFLFDTRTTFLDMVID